ncbi:hypothetical protein [Streptomyces sp. NPDC048361]|uniref:hypothetical protein n=1 Tax=Streptomyces sp. NPDC048361 TaxID=3154720 RepID=UPI0034331B1E
MDHLVLVLESTRQLTRATAVDEACRHVDRRVRHFEELAVQITVLCAQLGLGPEEGAAVHTYVDIMATWMTPG